MRPSFRVWGVSGVSWAAVIAFTGAALAGALASSPPSLTVSPKGVVEGKTIDSDEAFEMTLHLQGDTSSTYDLAVAYEGDAVGTCQADAATIATNPEGKGVWTCQLDTAVNEGTEPLTGTVKFTATKDDQSAELTATLSVRPAEVEEEAEVEEAAEVEEVEAEESDDSINHGHCVSYWAHESKEQGLEGRNRGSFISTVAQDDAAIAPKTEAGGDPGAECDFSEELTEALAAQEAAAAEDTDGEGSEDTTAEEESAKGSRKHPKE